MNPRGKKRHFTPGDIKWIMCKHAHDGIAPVRKELGDANYKEEKQAIKEFFCQYINTGDHCTAKALGISPLGGTKKSGKSFKMRWAVAGSGKSGGLRLAVVAYCEEKKVMIVGGWMRRDDPSDAEFEAVFKGL